MVSDSSSCALETPDAEDPPTPDWGVNPPPLTKFHGLWGPSTCRQSARESSRGYSLHRLPLASDVRVRGGGKVTLGTVLNALQRWSGWW